MTIKAKGLRITGSKAENIKSIKDYLADFNSSDKGKEIAIRMLSLLELNGVEVDSGETIILYGFIPR